MKKNISPSHRHTWASLAAVACFSMSVAIADDTAPLVGRYKGTWRSPNGERGTAVLVIKSGRPYRDGFAYAGTFQFQNTSDPVCSRVNGLEIADTSSGLTFEALNTEGFTMVDIVNAGICKTDKGFNGGLMVTVSRGPGSHQRVKVQVNLERE